MSGLATLALSAAPLAGGVLIGGMAGGRSTSAADLRGAIKVELDLLERIPTDEPARRAALVSMIGEQVDALARAAERSRELQRKFGYVIEHWRDLVLVLCTVLFAVIAWYADHNRPLWLPIFIAAILVSAVTATVTLRGFLRSLRPYDRGRRP